MAAHMVSEYFEESFMSMLERKRHTVSIRNNAIARFTDMGSNYAVSDATARDSPRVKIPSIQ
jgi:hypothetical protein